MRLTAQGRRRSPLRKMISRGGVMIPARNWSEVVLFENPRGYCPDHGTGVSCPIGVGVEA